MKYWLKPGIRGDAWSKLEIINIFKIFNPYNYAPLFCNNAKLIITVKEHKIKNIVISKTPDAGPTKISKSINVIINKDKKEMRVNK